MWKVKAGTQIKVLAPFGKVGSPSTVFEGGNSFTDTQPWKAYTTKEDKVYDKEQVWDQVAVMNNRGDVPLWAKHNIQMNNYKEVIIHCDGKFAMVPRTAIEYLN